MAHAAERGLVWIRHWRGAVSCVACQFRIVGSVHLPPVTRIKSPRTPNTIGLCTEVNRWLGPSIKWYLTRVGLARVGSVWIWD